MGNGPSSLQTKINHAAYFSSLRSINHDLQTITSNRSSSSTLVSVSAIQPGQQMKSTNPNPTTPFNSSSILQEANRVHCCSSKEFIRRSTFWKTVGAITGFFLIALFAALGHYMLVKGLNGTPLETSFLTQTQFSAVSILLSTIFKAALTASMGTCFAQHLWYILRGKAMSLSMVEMLFVIRNDLFALLSPQGIRRAPLLFLMALLIWSLGIAVIYPPGALTVSVRTQEFTEHHNMSIMNPPISPQLDFSGDESFPTLSRGDPLHGPDKVFSNFPLDPEVRKFIYIDKSLSQIPLDAGIRQFIYSGPSNRLVYLAQTIKNNNQVSTFPNHPGENSTYNLQFRGPQFKCTTSEYNITLSAEYDPKEFVVPMWVSSWDDQKLIHSLTQYDIKTFNAHCRSNNSLVWNAYAVANEQVCESVSVLYNVSVTFPRGVQTVDYSISDARTLPRRVDIYDTIDISGAYDDPNLNPGKLYGIQLRLPSIPEALEEWHQKVSEAIPISNEWAILDSLMPFLDKEYFHSQYLPSDALSPPELLPLQRPMVLDGKCQQIEESPNSTDDLVRESWPGYLSYRGDPYLRGSVFHKSRYNEHEGLDPRHAFNLAENMLNGVLANITMSAISLGTWWDMVPVTSTRYSNTYTLSHPLNLVLPYSICLAAASVFVIISIWSLWCNRAPAADGGFLQIMLATMGNTEMSRIMLEEGVATIDDMSDELKSSKIRYGELVYEDELGKKGKRYGFGTAGEIISLGREDERV